MYNYGFSSYSYWIIHKCVDVLSFFPHIYKSGMSHLMYLCFALIIEEKLEGHIRVFGFVVRTQFFNIRKSVFMRKFFGNQRVLSARAKNNRLGLYENSNLIRKFDSNSYHDCLCIQILPRERKNVFIQHA